MDDTFAPELEQIFAQHKVDDKIKKYLLGLTPPIATVASFASLVGPDDELTTLLFDPAGISALEPTARTPAKANLRAAMAQAKDTFAVACGPKETHSTPTADDPDAAVDDGTKKNLFEKWSKAAPFRMELVDTPSDSLLGRVLRKRRNGLVEVIPLSRCTDQTSAPATERTRFLTGDIRLATTPPSRNLHYARSSLHLLHAIRVLCNAYVLAAQDGEDAEWFSLEVAAAYVSAIEQQLRAAEYFGGHLIPQIMTLEQRHREEWARILQEHPGTSLSQAVKDTLLRLQPLWPTTPMYQAAQDTATTPNRPATNNPPATMDSAPGNNKRPATPDDADREICRNFQRGRCNKKNCRRRHVAPQKRTSQTWSASSWQTKQ